MVAQASLDCRRRYSGERSVLHLPRRLVDMDRNRECFAAAAAAAAAHRGSAKIIEADGDPTLARAGAGNLHTLMSRSGAFDEPDRPDPVSLVSSPRESVHFL